MAALLLLCMTVIVAELGSPGVASLLADLVFFLMGAGVLLLLIDFARGDRSTASRPEAAPVPSHGTAEPQKGDPELREGGIVPVEK